MPKVFSLWSCAIKPAILPIADHDWKSLYRAVILETDTSIIPKTVSKAQKAVLARGRELSYSSGTREEQGDLEDALYALRAYRTAWEHADAEITSTGEAAAA
jgi:hypothetical protein